MEMFSGNISGTMHDIDMGSTPLYLASIVQHIRPVKFDDSLSKHLGDFFPKVFLYDGLTQRHLVFFNQKSYIKTGSLVK